MRRMAEQGWLPDGGFRIGPDAFYVDSRGSTVCRPAKNSPVLEASAPVPAVGCPGYEGCEAPICPLDNSSLKHSVWYVGEAICRRRTFSGGNPHWRVIQKRIEKKATSSERFFTYRDFTRSKVIKPRGHDPISGF